MNFWERLLKIDRRIIFLVVGVAVLIPILIPFKLPTNVMPPTRKLYTAVDETAPATQAIIISVDYDPQTMPELQPMYKGLLRHAFARRTPALVVTGTILALGIAKQGMDDVAAEFNQTATTSKDSILYGRDYVFLGWPPLWLAAVLRMGSDISQAFPADYYKNRTASLEAMKRIKNYNDVGVIVSIAGNAFPITWAVYVGARFGVKVGAGITAVSVADMYPYLNSGQIVGLLAGLKGASEYEYLVKTHYQTSGQTPAIQGMSSQSIAQLAIIALVILGNIGYFATRRRHK